MVGSELAIDPPSGLIFETVIPATNPIMRRDATTRTTNSVDRAVLAPILTVDITFGNLQE